MSTPLFPNLPGLTFSRPKFATTGKTIPQESLSGKEIRISTQSRPRWNYQLSYDVLRGFGPMLGQYANFDQPPNFDNLINFDTLVENEFAVLQGFMIALSGSFGEFLYDDPKDNTVGLYQFATADGLSAAWQTRYDSTYQNQFPQKPLSPLLFLDQSPYGALALNAFGPFSTASIDATGLVTSTVTPQRGQPLYIVGPQATNATLGYLPGEQFGSGDGITTAFQLTRVVGGVATGYAEPIQNLNGNPALWVNGILKTAGADYTISSTGIVTFISAPALNAVLSWAGKYYIRLRFKNDDTQFSELVHRLYEAQKIEALSILL